jgi:hypothetical protein
MEALLNFDEKLARKLINLFIISLGRLSYVNFGLKWFNTELLSDIEIFSDLTSNGSPSSFRCHQLVIFLNSPALLDSIKNRPMEDNNTTKYIIIEELQGKEKETESFLKSLYDPLDGDSYDSFNSIYTVSIMDITRSIDIYTHFSIRNIK